MPTPQYTPRVVAFLGCLEAMGLAAYLDSESIWTWALGLTKAAGINVLQYKDHPADLATCLRASVDRLAKAYLPAVLHAFAGHTLTEAQLAAALSFHWNTGKIQSAEWVKQWCAGDIAAARVGIVKQWGSDGVLTARREIERDLYFDGRWPANLHVRVFTTGAAHHYQPVGGVMTDILPMLQSIMGGS